MIYITCALLITFAHSFQMSDLKIIKCQQILKFLKNPIICEKIIK